MSLSSSNWVFESGIVFEKDKAALKKAKQIEKNNLNKGYRWVKVNERNKIFVPCDKNGAPTEEGQRRIQLFKNAIGIK